MRAIQTALAGLLAIALAACGGGGGGGGGSPAPAPTYTVSGSIAGLLPGNSVVLTNDGANATSFTTNGTKSYTGAIATGTAYAIAVKTQPLGQTCTVSNGSGTISSANVTNVTVTCTANPYTVTANVSGLANAQSLVLQLNGGGNTTVMADGSYTFGAAVPSGSSYAVTILTAPAGQPCAVTQGSGKIAGANISNVQVTCGPTAYNVSVNLTGLPYGASITLQNGADVLPLTTNGTAPFPTPVNYNTSYAVSITVAPQNQNCAISGGSGSGTVTGNVTVAVDCPHFAYVSTNMDNGVAIFAIDNTTGVLTPKTPLANAATGPYGIAISPNLKYVYVPSTGTTGVNGYLSDPASAALSAINGGTAFATDNNPWSVAFDPTGTVAFVTNFGSNTVSSYTADPSTGLLTPASVASYPVGTNPFGVVVAPLANFVYVANSNSPSISVFAFDGTGTLTEITGSPFTVGDVDPVMAIDPTGSFAYVLGSTQAFLYAFTIDSTGKLTAVPGGPITTATNNPSGIAIHPNGRFVYVVNYASPLGSVSGYTITPVTGALTPFPTGAVVTAGNGAESITIDPTGQFAYVTNQVDSTISAYSIDANSGVLTALTTSASVSTGIMNKPEIIVFR